EVGLALAHLGAVPAFADRDLAKGAAGLLGVEAMHWAVLRRALGEAPVPAPIIG
ncbi:MAG: ferritin-like domain-containing protein, partial [Alphaproteobacteria bacterium]|nr:ferritin-like domain-containing protein [Alphaproteobacteria bacterium]